MDDVKKAKKKAWEEVKKGVGEVKKSSQEQMRKKVDAYKQLELAIPQAEIDREHNPAALCFSECTCRFTFSRVYFHV